MDISSVNNVASINAISNKSNAYLEAVRPNQHEAKTANNVTISEAGKAAAKIDMNGNGSYPPLEMFQIPVWKLEYMTVQRVGEGANTKYPEVIVGKEVSKIPYGDRPEYQEIVQSNYTKNLRSFGVDSVKEHYEAVILDKDKSDLIQKSFEAMMDNDSRVIAMLNNR